MIPGIGFNIARAVLPAIEITTLAATSYFNAVNIATTITGGTISGYTTGIVYSSSNSTPTVGGSGCSTKDASSNFIIVPSWTLIQGHTVFPVGAKWYFRPYFAYDGVYYYGTTKTFTTTLCEPAISDFIQTDNGGGSVTISDMYINAKGNANVSGSCWWYTSDGTTVYTQVLSTTAITFTYTHSSHPVTLLLKANINVNGLNYPIYLGDITLT